MGFRAKIDTELNSKVSIGININPSYSKRERPSVSFIDYVKCYSFLPYKHTESTAALTGQEVGTYAHPYHLTPFTLGQMEPHLMVIHGHQAITTLYQQLRNTDDTNQTTDYNLLRM